MIQPQSMQITKFIILAFFLIPITSNSIYSQCTGNCSGSSTSYGYGTGVTGESVSFFGRQTGAANLDDGEFNAFFGYQTGINNTTGDDNTFYGTQAGFHNTIGSRNSFFGRLAGEFNASSDNSFFGFRSGDSNTGGFSNSFFGSGAGNNNTIGSLNTFIGQGAGSNNITGNWNVVIGNNAGPVFGDVDSTLYIDIQPTSFPLIYGHFGERQVAINGSVEIMENTRVLGELEIFGGLAGASSRYIKQNFSNIDPQDILQKVSSLPITTWEYISKPGVRHIGPMAQDFYAAFGLGKNDVTIATVDADGLAFTSIKALHDLLKQEQKANQEQKELIATLIKRIEQLETGQGKK